MMHFCAHRFDPCWLQRQVDQTESWKLLRDGAMHPDCPLLVLVHPGSLMGSYAMHYQYYGQAIGWRSPLELRQHIARELAEWDDDEANMLGDFIDEVVPPTMGVSQMPCLSTGMGRPC